MKPIHIQREPIFTRNFLLIFLAGGLVRICYQIQNTITPLYMKSFGYSAAIAGMLTTVCTVASLALRPFLGGLLDKYSRKAIVLAGTLIFALATLMNGFFSAIVLLVIVKAMQGVGFSAHTTAVNTMATDVLPETRMSEGIGYMGLTGSVSMAIAPAIALGFIQRGAYAPAYATASIVGLMAVGMLAFCRNTQKIPVGKAEAQTEEHNGRKNAIWTKYFERNALKPSALMLLLGACYAAPATFLTMSALNRGFSSAQIGIYFTVNAAAMALARLFGGRAAQKIGMHKSMLISTLLNVAAFLLIFAARQPYMLWIAAGLYGLGYGTVYPMLNAAAVTLSPAHRRGTAMATFLTAMDIGIGFGASIWGLLIDWMGLDMLYLLCAMVSALVYVLYRLFMGKAIKA